IEDDFMDVLGISNISSFEPVDDVNPRLHRRLLLFLSKIDKERLNKANQFVDYLRSHPLIADDSIRHVWSPQQRQQFLLRYEESNRERPGEADLPGNGKFLFAEEENEAWEPPRETSEVELVNTIISIWNTLAEEGGGHELTNSNRRSARRAGVDTSTT